MMKRDDNGKSQAELSDLADRLRDLASALAGLRALGTDSIQAEVCIDDWVLAKRAVPILVGRMGGHQTLKEGNVGATTEIFFIDTAAGLARSFNRWCRLGPGVTVQAVLQ